MTKKTGRGGATPYYYIHARRRKAEGRQGRRGEAEGRGGHCGTAAVYRTEERGGGNNASYEQKVTNSCKKERFCARLKDECALFYNLLALSRLGITWCGEK